MTAKSSDKNQTILPSVTWKPYRKEEEKEERRN